MLASVLRSLESYTVLYSMYKNSVLVIDGYTLWKCFNFVLEACLEGTLSTCVLPCQAAHGP